MTPRAFALLFAVMLVAGGCGDDDGSIVDSGVVDAGPADATPDAEGPIDGGAVDSATPPDGGAIDAEGSDAITPADGGALPDFGPDAEIRPCGDGTCAPDEDCASCAVDCGSCPLAWTPLAPLPPESSIDLNGIHFPVSALVGFAVGGGGTIVKTTDGGATWTDLNSQTNSALHDVYFVDERTGYAVGDTGIVTKTMDGGASWDADLTTGTNATLRAVAFTDTQIGYVVGDGGLILKTLNGGATWVRLNSRTTEPLYGIQFVDAETGFVVGGGGVVLGTGNAGVGWTVLGAGTTPNTLRGVAFSADGRTGYAVGDSGTVIKSQTSGSSWSSIGSGTTADLWAVDFPLDDLHGHAAGEGGIILRTIDGGTNWQREDALTDEDLRDVAFPAYWTFGYVVGVGASASKRVPPWDDSVVYDTEVANLAPPTLSEGNVFVVNSAGFLFAIRPADRVALYRPVLLEDAAQSRNPVAPLDGETDATIFVATSGGVGYAIDATTGGVRWQTDDNAQTSAIDPLGEALVASPVVSPSRNLAYFATRNLAGEENRVFAFDAKTGACQWVVNGTCNGGTGTLKLGQVSGAPVHDGIFQRRLYLTSASLDGGSTVWAIDAGDTNGGDIAWSRNLGSSRAAPAFAPTDASVLGSLFIGTDAGRVYRIQTSDGASCWSESGTGCGDLAGAEQAFCTATDTRSASCPAGSAVTAGLFTLFGDPLRVVFATADGHLRMLAADGQLLWKTAAPIAGAAFPLVLPSTSGVYVGSSDGHLYQLDLTDGSVVATQQVGDGRAIIGSPSYFDDPTPANADMIFVGTGFGLLHGYQLPL